MDVINVVKNLDKEVTCAICLEHFVDPKQLPCLHSFCLKCVNSLAKHQTGTVECPTCRAEVVIPENRTFESLPSSFYLSNLLDVLAIKECDTTSITCDNCAQETKRGSYCFECCEFLCETRCLAAHGVLKITREHRVLELQRFREEDLRDVFKRLPCCEQKHHDKEVLKFFCKTCSLCVCRDCVVTSHNQHNVIHLAQKADEADSQIASTVTKGKEKASEYERDVRLIAKRLKEIEKCADNSTRDIDNLVETLIIKIREKKEKLIRQVEGACNSLQTELEEQKSDLLEKITEINCFLDHTDAVRRRSTSAELFSLQKNVEMKLNPMIKKNAKRVTESTYLYFIPAAEPGKVLDEVGIGRVVESVIDVNQTSVTSPSAGVCILSTKTSGGKVHHEQCLVPEIQIKSMVSGKVVPHQIQDNNDGTYTVMYAGLTKYYMHIKIHGQEIFGSPFPLESKISSQAFGGVGCANRKFSCPWGVAVNCNEQIIVTDHGNHRVQIFTSKGAHLTTFDGNGSRAGILKKPTGVVCDKHNSIFVADAGNNRIHVFDQDGASVRTFSVRISSDKKPPRLQGLALDSNENVIAVDCNNSRVKVYGQQGKLLSSFVTSVGEKVSCPVYCVEHCGLYYVTDEAENCIKIFQTNGSFVSKFGKTGFVPGTFNRPCGLVFDKDGHLIVCDTSNDRIQIFDKCGSVIGVIDVDCEKKSLPQLDSPLSLAIMKDSRKLIVSSFNNDTIQIWDKW